MSVRRGKLIDLGSVLSDQPIDLFVGSASFESRCHSITSHLGRVTVRNAIIGVNRTHWAAVEDSVALFRGRFGSSMVELDLYSDDPIRSADNMDRVLLQRISGSQMRIVVDISTFTRESLLMLVFFLRKRLKDSHQVTFLYASAAEYSVGSSESDKWLSKGIRDVRSVLGFPGKMYPSRPMHLIVMLGFEDYRALELIHRCQPRFVSLGSGDYSDLATSPHQSTNESRLARLEGFLHRVERFSFSAYDPRLTMRSLEQQAVIFGDSNVVVAPMHTKISTLGAALAAIRDDSLQVCYASAGIYNVGGYSVPGEEFYMFELPELCP